MRIRYAFGAALGLLSLAIVAAIVMMPVVPAQAQARRTPVNFQATSQAVQANLAATSQAAEGNIQATGSALETDLLATSQAAQSSILATAEAFSASANTSAEGLQATATAIAQQLPALQDLSSEALAAYLNYITQNGSVSVDTEAGVVTTTYNLNEPTVNELLTQILQTGDFNATSVIVDFISEGAIITATDVTLTETISGDLSAFIGLTAVDGEAQVTLYAATINDNALPQAVLDELEAQFSALIDATLTGATASELDYSVDALYTTDSSLVAVVSVPFAPQ